MKEKIIEAVLNGDNEYLDLIVQVVDMSDEAKQVLRDKGYGYLGLDLLRTCKLVPDNEEY